MHYAIFYQLQTKGETSSFGRTKRKSRKVVDYSESRDSNDLEKYIEKVQKEMEGQQKSVSFSPLKCWFDIWNISFIFFTDSKKINLVFLFSPAPLIDVKMPVDAQITLKLQNILMLLKRCCNHPYLIEYPLVPGTEQFKVITVLELLTPKSHVTEA